MEHTNVDIFMVNNCDFTLFFPSSEFKCKARESLKKKKLYIQYEKIAPFVAV